MVIEGGRLFVTKGADEIYYLDEAKEGFAEPIFNAYQDDRLDGLADEDGFGGIIKALEKAGVIYKERFIEGNALKIAIRYYGSPLDGLAIEGATAAADASDCGLLILARTNTTLRQVLEGYGEISVPHLFVDLAYSHTISIGPLVFKNDTACLGCFIGRLAKNWGDAPPPDEPCVAAKTALAAALVQEKTKEMEKYGNCPDLVNNVWSFDTNRFTARYDRVHKLPWCPACGEKENGAIGLPWARGAPR